MSHTAQRRWTWLLTAFLGGLCTLGCGSARYEERLEATAVMFRHREKLDRNLQHPFKEKLSGVQIRPPRGLTMIPAPEVTKGSDGEETYPDVDNRHPPFFTSPLPGMIAAWKDTVTVSSGNDARSAEAYMIVLSSLGPRAVDPDDVGFRTLVLDILNRDLGAKLSIGSLHEALYPPNSQTGYVPQVRYLERKVVPERLIDDLQVQLMVYLHETEQEQTFVLFVVPRKMSGLTDFEADVDLCLQTLRVNPPSPESGGSGGGGGRRSGGL